MYRLICVLGHRLHWVFSQIIKQFLVKNIYIYIVHLMFKKIKSNNTGRRFLGYKITLGIYVR